MKTRTIASDVVVVGSGPSGVAIAERLYESHPTASIAIVERGDILLRKHFYDSGGTIQQRDAFLAAHRFCPWLGDLSAGGALLPALGGRGVLGGAQLHRFYDADLSAWPNGHWPIGAGELDAHFRAAEAALLGRTRSVGSAQDRATELLAGLSASHPPHSDAPLAGRSLGAGYPHRSAVERILALVARDQARPSRRVTVLTGTRAVRLAASKRIPDVVSRVECVRGVNGKIARLDLRGRVVVLAASPIESTRLVMVSNLEGVNAPALGRYLAEHIYVRGTLDVSAARGLTSGSINLHIPPQAEEIGSRFQVEVRSIGVSEGRILIRVTGSAAMDPDPDNRVVLSADLCDELGIPRAQTLLTPSAEDQSRTRSMTDFLHEVARRLGGNWLVEPSTLPAGASYHESGTLRIGSAQNESERVADSDGRLLGTQNVYVGDGAAFPCVGVANPILTLTAMGYRLADGLVAAERWSAV